ncbi:hypothetical protein [Arthrobacter oryzae]|uniref:hypothetical protein n=1 Tax=Arthrobacter oryzae TaxID=409290 RepID=UPI0011CE126B|nr:hypothetical protein [Arthrobacter oryzae]
MNETKGAKVAKGTYERTPLTQARFKLTMTNQRIERLRERLDEAELQKRRLEYEIEELEAEAK